MKKILTPISSIFLAIISPLSNAEYIAINTIDKHSLSINMEGKYYATHNPEYFFYKTYDIGLKESFKFKDLVTELYYAPQMNDDDKFNFVIKKLYAGSQDIDLYNPFVKKRLEKEKYKYIEIYNSAVKEAKKVVENIDGFIFKDILVHSNKYIFEDSTLSFGNSLPNVAYNKLSFIDDDNVNYINNFGDLTCKQTYDKTSCNYYIDLPEDIAEMIYNNKAATLFDIKLKSLNHFNKKGEINVNLENIEVSVIDAQTHYIQFLAHDPNAALRNIMSNSEYSVLNIEPKDLIMDRKELYRTKLKVRRVPDSFYKY